ncbi:hypothetical protein [Rubinisphaera margarita]|uniref:hypothetical protein n=1 Tax=Rubinisphaera margarita TaxID=2909586 RepID=UPI001EE839BC|nr:hypothetical protein [Rubinisphaera margarita]MCG6157727.1 hypothetical protein [Rubinisphaera margarita]
MSRAIVSQPPHRRAPFIADQKLLHLQIHEQSTTKSGFYWDIYDHLEDEETTEDAQGRWSWNNQFADRQLLLEALIAEPAFRRTLLITYTGFGQSTFLKWLQYALLKTYPGLLPVFMETTTLIDHEHANDDRDQ